MFQGDPQLDRELRSERGKRPRRRRDYLAILVGILIVVLILLVIANLGWGA